jgi:hypothetical protein
MVLLPLSACAAHFEVDCDVLEYRRLSCLLILRRTSTGNVHIRTVAGIGIEKEKNKQQATRSQCVKPVKSFSFLAFSDNLDMKIFCISGNN